MLGTHVSRWRSRRGMPPVFCKLGECEALLTSLEIRTWTTISRIFCGRLLPRQASAGSRPDAPRGKIQLEEEEGKEEDDDEVRRKGEGMEFASILVPIY